MSNSKLGIITLLKITLALATLVFSTVSLAEDALSSLVGKYSDAETAKATEPQSAKANPKEASVKGVPKEAIAKTEVFTIQVGSFTNSNDAKVKINELRKNEFQVFSTEANVDGTKRYRVNIGRFSDRDSAKIFVKEKLPSRLQEIAIVIRTEASELKSKVAQTPEPKKLIAQRPAPEIKKEEISKPVTEVKAPEAKVENTEEVETGLLGGWGGVKPKFRKAGADLNLRYKGEYVQNANGGIERKGDYLGNVDVMGDFNLEKIVGAQGLSLYLYGLGNHGGRPKEFIGDTFGSSNIEAPNTFKLYEAYFRQAVDDRFSVIAGLRDLNADFYTTESSGYFFNSAFGISPALSQTGSNGPSIFPTTALAVELKYDSPTAFYLRTAAFNAKAGDAGTPKGTYINTEFKEGYLLVYEAGYAAGEKKERYKISAGTWTYTKPQATIDTTKGTKQNSGYYFLVDKNITDSAAVFVKYGIADEEINKFSSAAEYGVTYKGLVPTRDDDVLALAMAKSQVSRDYERTNSSKDYESVVEVSYQFNLGHGVKLTPDYQFITNTGLSQTLKNAEVQTIRVEINF